MSVAPVRALAEAINVRVATGAEIPLVVLRCRTELQADHSCEASVRRCLRTRDVLAYDAQTGAYAAALLAEPRSGIAGDAQLRGAASRIAGVLGHATALRVESALARVARTIDSAGLRRTMHAALLRDERRRELAYVAHELRSPLASIRGYLELMLEPRNDAVSQLRFLETARGEALRLGRLLDAMTEVSLLDGSAVRATGTCDVAPAVDHAVEAILPRAVARGVRVTVPRRTRLPARVSPDDCVRASVNILHNAIDAGASVVEVSSKCTEGLITIAIDDDGPGVAACERRAIFEVETRGRAASRYPGSGFGLAAVAAIARANGGSVGVSTSRLGGARFFLRFERA